MKIKHLATLGKIAACCGIVLPAAAQYAGPAILSRGEAPSAMNRPEIDFRPFARIEGGYSTGLAGVGVTADGTVPNYDSWLASIGWGISGTHSWRRTKVGLTYSGGLYHYINHGTYDSFHHELLLGVVHQLTRHTTLSLASSGGIFTRDTGLRTLQQTVPFDPTTTFVPTQDYFDNRTYYAAVQAQATVQQTARLSFNFGGGFFYTDYRSHALTSSFGYNATGDFQYRLRRRVTLGLVYGYGKYTYRDVFGGTDFHTLAGAFAFGISPHLEVSGYAGAARVESKFLRQVEIDPVIQAILGIIRGTEVGYNRQYVPNFAVRVSRTFSRGVLTGSAGRSIVPGNGLFLTSFATIVRGSYSYTGLRRWSFTAALEDSNHSTATDIQGHYSTASAGFSVSRKITGSLHAVAQGSIRRYGSSDFHSYNRTVGDVTVGLGFAPGDIPLRVW